MEKNTIGVKEQIQAATSLKQIDDLVQQSGGYRGMSAKTSRRILREANKRGQFLVAQEEARA